MMHSETDAETPAADAAQSEASAPKTPAVANAAQSLASVIAAADAAGAELGDMLRGLRAGDRNEDSQVAASPLD